MSAQIGARRTLKLRPKADAASDVRTRPTAESGGALAVQTPSTRPARPVGRSRGVPRGLTAEPEVVSRTRRPRTRRGGTTPSAVSTRRRPRSAKGVFGHVAENAVPRSIFFLAWLTRDFAQNFRDARSGRDLATINRRAPWRPQRRRRKSLRSGIVPRQGRVLGTPRVVLHAPAAPRPAQGWRRTDRSPQTSVAPYVWRTPPFLPIAEMGSNRVYFVSPAVGLLGAEKKPSVCLR